MLLQQVEGGVVLLTVESLAFDVFERRAIPLVNLLNQPLEAGKAGGVGNAGAAKEHHNHGTLWGNGG